MTWQAPGHPDASTGLDAHACPTCPACCCTCRLAPTARPPAATHARLLLLRMLLVCCCAPVTCVLPLTCCCAPAPAARPHVLLRMHVGTTSARGNCPCLRSASSSTNENTCNMKHCCKIRLKQVKYLKHRLAAYVYSY
jgi:hypothetical protein